jgi:hypothetical protein
MTYVTMTQRVPREVDGDIQVETANVFEGAGLAPHIDEDFADKIFGAIGVDPETDDEVVNANVMSKVRRPHVPDAIAFMRLSSNFPSGEYSEYFERPIKTFLAVIVPLAAPYLWRPLCTHQLIKCVLVPVEGEMSNPRHIQGAAVCSTLHNAAHKLLPLPMIDRREYLGKVARAAGPVLKTDGSSRGLSNHLHLATFSSNRR